MLLLLLSRFSPVRLCATPEMAAHQAAPTLGFSRQEHWSGLSFPSPMHESESESKAAQSCLTLSNLLQPNRLLRPWDSPGESTGVGCHCLLQQRSLYTPNSILLPCLVQIQLFSAFPATQNKEEHFVIRSGQVAHKIYIC